MPSRQVHYSRKYRWVKQVVKLGMEFLKTQTRVVPPPLLMPLLEHLYDLGTRGEEIFLGGEADGMPPEWLRSIGDYLNVVEILSTQVADLCRQRGLDDRYLNAYMNPLGGRIDAITIGGDRIDHVGGRSEEQEPAEEARVPGVSDPPP